MKLSEILKEDGPKYNQIFESYGDGESCRCAVGVILSHYGWRPRGEATLNWLTAINAIKRNNLPFDILNEMITMNDDKRLTFEQIASKLEEGGR